MTKEMIQNLIAQHDPDEEFCNLEYPDHKQALLEFLGENGIEVQSSDIEEKTGEPYIDGDGYSGIDSILTIRSLQMKISITAFQHRGWDFYFNHIE